MYRRGTSICNAFILFLTASVFAGTGWSMQDHGGAMGKSSDHSSHMFSMGKKTTKTVVKYNIPDLVLLTQKGGKVNLKEFIKQDKPVLVDFIFTTCTTICPILSAGFSHFQSELGQQREEVQLISITIDPEHDTPRILDEYAERFGAEKGWTFLTGDKSDIVKAMHAFDAYVSDKMSHQPLTFLRAPGDEEWLRVDGLMSGAELMKEYDDLLSACCGKLKSP